jgi:large subunit ribosomal protein L6
MQASIRQHSNFVDLETVIIYMCAGPKGSADQNIYPLALLTQEGDTLKVSRTADTHEASAMHGTARAITANMVQGVHVGFERRLQLLGTGYRAKLVDDTLVLSVGHRHPVEVHLPRGTLERVYLNTHVTLWGM